MTGVRAGSQGTGLNAGSQGTGVSGAPPAPSAPPEPIFTVDGFSQTLGAQTFALPAEAVEGTWVVFFYSTSGTNAIGGPPTDWTLIAQTQRVGAYYKQIGPGETATSAIGASNGYPHWGFLVFDQEITISQPYAGISLGTAPDQNWSPEFGVYNFATKYAVMAAQSVYGWRHSTNDYSATPTDPAVTVLEELTTFGSDSSASLLRQDGAGVDIVMQYSVTNASAGVSFVLEAA